MTRIPLTALVALALALAGCGDAAGGVDHSDAQAVARAYAIADHEHDHETVYQLLHLNRRDGASLDEWVEEQRKEMASDDYSYQSRYDADDGNGRKSEPREVEKVETAPSSRPYNLPPDGRAVDVVVHFADGERASFAYMLIETDEGWRVDATLDRS